MSKEPSHIVIRGARHHNLQIDELRLPKLSLTVFTGVSGSGKSSLAFDTLFAEGQRRYVESLSSYARQFLGQLEKPAVEHISGLSPTIAIEQKTAASNPRSTVGTITEVQDFLRVLFARLGRQHCTDCGAPVEALSSAEIMARLKQLSGKQLLLAPLFEQRKGEHRDLLESLRQRGFVRVRLDGEVVRLEGLVALDKKRKHQLELVVDRFSPSRVSLQRLTDSVETALREGQGLLLAQSATGGEALRLGRARACAQCQIAFPALTPQHFSFNSPLGMCPACNGLGVQTQLDPKLLVPDDRLSLRQGALVPYASVMARGSGISFGIFDALRKELGLDLDAPWRSLPKRQRELVLYGTKDRRVAVSWEGTHGRVSWPMQFEGVVNLLMRRFRETKSEEMRRHYASFMGESPCPDCGGARLSPIARSVRLATLSLDRLSALPVAEAAKALEQLELTASERQVGGELLREVVSRLEFLDSVGLGYLSLERSGATLSGGEAQRIRLAAQLGSELSGVLYVLDEPSIGLHPRDTQRLVETLERLRDSGNTVIVVEHERGTIEAADHIVDFGPGAGRAGGAVVFEGTPRQLLTADTLTGGYLSGRLVVAEPRERRAGKGELLLLGASENNLKELDVAFPLGTLTAVTGVSGAGKSSLVSEILQPELSRRLHNAQGRVGSFRSLQGADAIDKVVLVDQSPIGRTPRSNPATYTKAFDEIRQLFAQTPDARALGYGPGRFSFNVADGRCGACEGDGVKRVEMHFLSDVFVTCEICAGRRYDEATLAVKYRERSIADVLETSVDDALELFAAFPSLVATLKTLADVGLGYLHLGQPAPTLSGGEAQRVKLSRELARRDTGRTLYVLDEPTTGLHFDDVAKLLRVLGRLVDAGNTVIVIEHDLDVIAAADHVIDLGPEGGSSGGYLVVAGTPEQVASCEESHTGRALRALQRRGLGGSQYKPTRSARGRVKKDA